MWAITFLRIKNVIPTFVLMGVMAVHQAIQSSYSHVILITKTNTGKKYRKPMDIHVFKNVMLQGFPLMAKVVPTVAKHYIYGPTITIMPTNTGI